MESGGVTGSPERNGSALQALARPVRVAVWGLGAHARRRVLPAIAACPSTVLVGVTSRDVDVARSEADRFGCQAWLTPAAMLASADVDSVYLATPIGLHHAHGKEVLAAGKHLWCEKSLTTCRADSEELIDLARRARRSVCEAFMYAYHPQFVRVADLIRRGSLGRLKSIACRFGMPFLERPGFRHSAQLGGGALLDVGCYPLSLALRLVAEEPRVLLKQSRGAPGLEVDVEGYAVLEFPSGTLAHLEWGFGRSYVNDVRVWGENGSLGARYIFSKPDDFETTLEVDDVRGVRRTETVEGANQFVRMLETFARASDDEQVQEQLRREAEHQARQLDALRP